LTPPHALLDEHITHVVARIAELQNLERQLKGLRRQCRPARVEKACGIFDGLRQGAPARSDDYSGSWWTEIPGHRGQRFHLNVDRTLA
jgi:hypothetical protein